MTDSTGNLQEKIGVLRRVYALELPAKVAEMEALFQRLQETGDQSEALVSLKRLAHNLVGSGATYGFPEVSEKARCLNAILKSAIGDFSEPMAAQLDEISKTLADLKESALRNLPTLDATPFDRRASVPPPLSPSREEIQTVFFMEKDPRLAKEIALQLSYFGYRMEVFPEVSEIQAALQNQTPAAVIADIGSDFPVVQHYLGTQGGNLPIVFLSSRDDLEARLNSVRAGGSAYFAMPVDVASLADKLDSLTNRQDPDLYRVLIVEDDEQVAKLQSTILRSSGMVTNEVTNPMQVMHSLVEFRPDLILMDIFMPLCNGMELAAVIRQQEAYVGVPIVFCSVEQDLAKQFQALLLGGDDFLTKPVSPDRLISLVSSRARRGRVLRSHIIHDGLTGLLNHSNLKMRLNLEVARARRHNERLSYAMIDIDHLKLINDTHGHIAGDRVIKTVSRLLKQRFRKTDIVGRYGGDEFAAILIDADVASSVKILEEVRESFSQIRYQTKDTDFSATMSCGVASFPEYGDAETLHAVSDKALFRSKADGGNRTSPAEGALP